MLALQPFSTGPPGLIPVLTILYLKPSWPSSWPPLLWPSWPLWPTKQDCCNLSNSCQQFQKLQKFFHFSSVPLGFNSCARPSCFHGNACSPGLNSCAKFCYDLPSTGIHRNIIKVAHICQKLSIVAISNPKLPNKNKNKDIKFAKNCHKLP